MIFTKKEILYQNSNEMIIRVKMKNPFDKTLKYKWKNKSFGELILFLLQLLTLELLYMKFVKK